MAKRGKQNTGVEEVVPSPPKTPPRAGPTHSSDREDRVLQAMTLQTFLATDFGPKRHDQCAGFAHHAKRMGPRNILEWRAAFAEFMRRPVQ